MSERRELPVGAKLVAWFLVAGGALFAVIGTIGIFDQVRAEALMGMLMLASGPGAPSTPKAG